MIDPASYITPFQNVTSLAKFGDITCHRMIAGYAAPCAFCKMPDAVQTGQITSRQFPVPNDEHLGPMGAKLSTMSGEVHAWRPSPTLRR